MPLLFACAAVAFACGALIGFLNYSFSKRILARRPEYFAVGTVVRQMLNVGLLLVCYLVGQGTSLSTVALLIGAALGITLPSLYFTPKLLELNRKGGEKDQQRKEENTDG